MEIHYKDVREWEGMEKRKLRDNWSYCVYIYEARYRADGRNTGRVKPALGWSLAGNKWMRSEATHVFILTMTCLKFWGEITAGKKQFIEAKTIPAPPLTQLS